MSKGRHESNIEALDSFSEITETEEIKMAIEELKKIIFIQRNTNSGIEITKRLSFSEKIEEAKKAESLYNRLKNVRELERLQVKLTQGAPIPRRRMELEKMIDEVLQAQSEGRQNLKITVERSVDEKLNKAIEVEKGKLSTSLRPNERQRHKENIDRLEALMRNTTRNHIAGGWGQFLDSVLTIQKIPLELRIPEGLEDVSENAGGDKKKLMDSVLTGLEDIQQNVEGDKKNLKLRKIAKAIDVERDKYNKSSSLRPYKRRHEENLDQLRELQSLMNVHENDGIDEAWDQFLDSVLIIQKITGVGLKIPKLTKEGATLELTKEAAEEARRGLIWKEEFITRDDIDRVLGKSPEESEGIRYDGDTVDKKPFVIEFKAKDVPEVPSLKYSDPMPLEQKLDYLATVGEKTVPDKLRRLMSVDNKEQIQRLLVDMVDDSGKLSHEMSQGIRSAHDDLSEIEEKIQEVKKQSETTFYRGDNGIEFRKGGEVVKSEISQGGQTEKAEAEQAEESRLKSLAEQSACLYNLATEAIGEEVKKRGDSLISWRRHDKNKKAIGLLFKKLNKEVKNSTLQSSTLQRGQELQIEALALFVRIKNRQSARGMDLTSTLECLQEKNKNWQDITTALRSDLLRNKGAVKDSLKGHKEKLKQAEALREVEIERKIARQKYDNANKNLENMGLLAAVTMTAGQKVELENIRRRLLEEYCKLYKPLETAEREVTGGEQGSALPNLREKIADVKIDTMLLSERIKEKRSSRGAENRHKKNRAVLSMLKGIEQSEKQRPELQKVLDAIFEKMEQGRLDMLEGIKQSTDQSQELQEALGDILKNMDNEEFKLSERQIACGKDLIDELLKKYVGGTQPGAEQDPLPERSDSTHHLMNQFATDFLHEKLDDFHDPQKKSTPQQDSSDLIDSHCGASKSIDLLNEYANQLNKGQVKSEAHGEAIGHLRNYWSNQLPQTP